MRHALLFSLLAASSAQAADVRVFAAASLSDVLGEAKELWSKTPSAAPIVFQFGASNDLARQIRAGAPAHLFFSADARQMEALETAQWIEPGTRRDVLSNALVLIAPRESRLQLFAPPDLNQDGVRRVALADPEAVPAGVYCREFLERAGVFRQIERKLVPTLDVRAALAAVASGNVDAGCVYKTDVSPRVRVFYEVPASDGPRIVYPLAAIRGRLTSEARGVLDFLLSREAAAVYTRHGFLRVSR